MNSLRLLWLRIATRVNAMTLRERFLLFACVIAALGAITYLLFISPLTAQQKRLVEQIDNKSAEMDMRIDETNAQISIRRRERMNEVNVAARKLQADIALVEKEIAAMSTTGVDAAAVSTILKRVLQRADRVALVRVLPVVAEPTAANARGASASPSGLDITVAGNYLDLMQYLALLEKEMPQARWGNLLVKADTMPVLLTVRILSTVAGS